MAHYRGIAAALAALEGLLQERCPCDEDGLAGSLDIRRIQPHELETPTADGPAGIGILLWRVTIDPQRRAPGPRTDLFGRRFKPSVPVDLSILLLPFAADAQVQHRILGWLLRALADAGTLDATRLNRYAKDKDVFAEDERVDLICDPLPVADHLMLCAQLKTPPLCVNYLVRTLMLDSEEPQEPDAEGPSDSSFFPSA